jgi:hypothetical protein
MAEFLLPFVQYQSEDLLFSLASGISSGIEMLVDMVLVYLVGVMYRCHIWQQLMQQ